MAKKNKKPIANVQVSGEKTPATKEDATSYYKKHPVWKFSKCDRNHDRWKLSEDKFNEDFLGKLINYERMTWSDIIQVFGGKKKGNNNHHVSVIEFCPEAQNRVKELNLEEHQDFFCLRLDGKSRLWGILINGVFHIIWKDDSHEVCVSRKRHT